MTRRDDHRQIYQMAMASKLVFSPSDDEILLQEVQANSILYDFADTNYNNTIMKDSIWKEISLKI